MSAIFSLIGLICIYLSKKSLVKQLTILIHRLGGGQRATIIIWSIIFLPGTIIHEVSHFLTAAFTGARTGRVEIFPEFLDEEFENEGKAGVALGYVQTQTLNPLQGFLVGTAPFTSGIILLIWLASLMQSSFVQESYYAMFLEGYLFFTIANSFFPSWSDIKQTLPLIAISIIVFLLAWYFGFQIFIPQQSSFWEVIKTLSNALNISVIFNVMIIGLLFLLNQISQKRRK